MASIFYRLFLIPALVAGIVYTGSYAQAVSSAVDHHLYATLLAELCATATWITVG